MKKPKEAKEALLHAVELGDKLELPGGYRDLREQLRTKANTL
jgi:hypothetical protein